MTDAATPLDRAVLAAREGGAPCRADPARRAGASLRARRRLRRAARRPTEALRAAGHRRLRGGGGLRNPGALAPGPRPARRALSGAPIRRALSDREGAAASAVAGLAAPFVGLGPHHARAPAFSARVLSLMWTDRRIRGATGGYLGHMWELYAMWGWIAAAASAGFAARMEPEAAQSLAALLAFLAIAVGAALCAPAGWLADRVGKARVSAGALTGSGAMALAVAATHGGPVWLSFGLVLLWGALVIPDSAQFSAMIADAAPPEAAGSLMTMQTALGFALTIFTVQATPLAAAAIGWPMTLALMAAGPAFGVAMLRPLLGRL